MRRRGEDLGSALRRCLVAPPPPTAQAPTAQAPAAQAGAQAPARTDRLLELAHGHGVSAYVRAQLAAGDGAAQAEDGRRSAVHHLGVTAALTVFGRLMDDAGIPWLVVKGPVLARVHPDPRWRPYADVDVVVAPQHFRAAIGVLDAHGHPPADTDWRRIRRTVPGQLHVPLPGGTVADVHWHLVNARLLRRRLRLDMHDVFARARRIRVDGLEVATLDATDTVAHAALHAAVGGATRLLWLKDIERCVARDPPDWAQLVVRVHGWRAGPPVGIALERARRFLGAAIPVEVVDELLGTTTRRALTRALDRRWPPVGAKAVTPASVWAQVATESWPSTGAALWRRLVRPLQTTRRRWRAPAAASTPGQARRLEAARRAYLAAVEAELRPGLAAGVRAGR